MRITAGNLDVPEVQQLIADHLADMGDTSPAESIHALDLSALRDPAISFWTVWTNNDDAALAGCGALKELADDQGEIKTMRTSEQMRGRGVGRLILNHIIDQARTRGYLRLSLETGSQDFFLPARTLYARHGFAECPPFGDYTEDPNSVYMTLALN